MRILFTGLSGFVGKNLKTYLSGFDIFSLVREETGKNEFTYQELSKCFEKEYDSVIHLAGKAHDLKNISKPKVYFDTNLILTQKVYDEFVKSDSKKFIFFSSVKAAADSLTKTLTEDYLPDPKTYYGKSKLEAENYLIQNQKEGTKLYILRPCMIHGPGNKGNLNLLFNFVKSGLPYPLGIFENQRSFLSVGNLCFIIKELIERDDIPSGIYNLSDDEPLSTNQVVNLLGVSLRKNIRIWCIPKGLILFLAKIGDLLGLPLNSERLNKLTDSYVVSNSKIKNAIDKPLPISSHQGLLKTANSFNNA